MNASNAVDAQSTYESAMSLFAVVMGHANMVHHGLGWLEGGLTASYEKTVIDAEMIRQWADCLKPIDVSDAELALDAIKDVAPGGHFFGSAHTLERYEKAFYQPMISDWRNFNQWEEAGSPQAVQKANALWKQALAEYREPYLDPASAEQIDAFVTRRVAEGGEVTDF